MNTRRDAPHSGPFMAQMSIQNEMIVGFGVCFGEKLYRFTAKRFTCECGVAMKPLSTQATRARGALSLLETQSRSSDANGKRLVNDIV